MSYTTNLGLRVVDNTDNFTDVFTQGNFNANKLEEKIGGYLDDMEELPQVVTDITNLQNSLLVLDGRVSQTENDITSLSNKIVAIENGKMTLKNDNNEDVEGVVTRYYLTVTTSGGTSEFDVPLANSHTGQILRIADVSANIHLNATALFNISSPSQCKIINAIVYNTRTSTTSPSDLRTSSPSFICEGFKKIPNDYNLYLDFHMQQIMMSIDEHTSFPDYSDVTYQVVIELWKPTIE